MFPSNVRQQLIAIVVSALIIGPATSFADLAIISHPSQSLDVSKDDIARIFLGKLKQVDGQKILPINLRAGDPVREHLNAIILNKSEAQLKSYWSRLVFTGKAQPPRDVDSQAEMLKLISLNPNMVGYVDSSQLSAEVKVIGSFVSD